MYTCAAIVRRDNRAVRALSVLLAIMHGVAASVAAAFVFVGGLVGCYENCSNAGPDWWERYDAWQWKAIASLGAVSGAAALTALALALVKRQLGASVALAAQAAALAAAGAFLIDSDVLSAGFVAFFGGCAVAPGAALILVRRRLPTPRAGARGTRGDPSA